jgi:DNA topoisomerase III
MKERGLGTPATRASIIENLLNDKDGKGNPKEPYMRRDKKALVPTEKGISLIGFLESQGIEQLCSPAMTGDWEARLRQVESGAVSREVFMRDIEKMTRDIVGTIMQGSKVGAQRLDCACPKCQGALLGSARTIDCESACGFKLWLEVARRKLSIEEATQLITTGHLAGLDGFVSTKSGKTFNAGLKLGEDFKAEFVFADRAAPGAAPSGAKLACACPACGKKDLVRNGRVIECGCGQFKLWTVVAQKQLTDAQLTALLTKGTVAVKGLTSGKGTKFDATLKLEPGGRVGFVF